MSKLEVRTFKVNPELWEAYGKVVEKLKELGILKSEESRGTLIASFIACYVVENNKRLKELKGK